MASQKSWSLVNNTLTREEMAKELGIPEAQLHPTTHVPRLGNRRQRRKMERLMRRRAPPKRHSDG